MNDASFSPAGLARQDEDEGSSLIKNIPTIAWQRRWMILVPTAVCTVAGVAAAYLITPSYRSESTLVIESQVLPSQIGTTPVNDLIDQRIARVRQRVLSRPDLIQLIRTNNLYPDMQASQPLSKIIDKMRDSTHIQAVASDLKAAGNDGMIAFTISFDYPDAGPAQLVVQQYVNSFLDLDAKSRSEDAAGAANFLGEQAASIQQQIQDVETQITRLKSQNGALLALQDRDTSDPAADAARIDADISGIMAENARLRATPAPEPEDPDVRQAEQALRIAETRFSDTHPDVIAARAQLQAAKDAAAKRPAAPNPITGQIKENEARIAALQNARSTILSQGATLRTAQSRAPAVAEQVDQLEQRAQGLRAQYADISGRLQNAQVSSRMESENKGERLSVADPPTVPDTPFWPNRKLLIAGGVIGGIGIGVVLSLLLELLFQPIRGTESLRLVTGRPPLVVIPPLDRKPGILVRLMERLSRRRLAKRPAPIA